MEKRLRFYKTIDQFEFEKQYPEIYQIYGHLPEFKIMYAKQKKKKTKKNPLEKFKFLMPPEPKK